MSASSGLPEPSLLQQVEQQRIDRLVAELKRRGVTNDRCPRCGTFDWAVSFFQMPAAHEGFVSPFGQGITGYIPVACFNCKNCGYLMYYNLRVIETSEVRK
jgi:hypothetical protein